MTPFARRSSALLGAALLATPVAAATTVTVEGETYAITTLAFDSTLGMSVLEAQPWWGNDTLAYALSGAVGIFEGLQNTLSSSGGIIGPVFALSVSFAFVDGEIISGPGGWVFVPDGGSIFSGDVASFLEYELEAPVVWAVVEGTEAPQSPTDPGTPVTPPGPVDPGAPVPVPARLALLPAALLALRALRRT